MPGCKERKDGESTQGLGESLKGRHEVELASHQH